MATSEKEFWFTDHDRYVWMTPEQQEDYAKYKKNKLKDYDQGMKVGIGIGLIAGFGLTWLVIISLVLHFRI